MISVCIATYNGEKYISKQLESILAQLLEEDEIIISDNGSTDRTLEIICNYSDSRIHVYKFVSPIVKCKYSIKHYLVTKNFENALKYAKGDYIFLSDQDDIWKENKVEVMGEYLKSYDLVMSNYDVINSCDKTLNSMFLNPKQLSNYLLSNLIRMPFWGCCMAFRREILEKALPFPPNLIMHDNWIGFVALMTGKVLYINYPLIFYRRHFSNVSSQKGMSTNPYWFRFYYRILFLSMLVKNIYRNKWVRNFFCF